MRKTYTLIAGMCLLALLLSSCRAKFYTPNRNPIPLFREKGDLFADASVSASVSKFDGTVGYAFNNFLGAYVGASHSTLKGEISDSSNPTDYRYTGDMLNLGLGYYLNRKISGPIRFEIFADYGMGNYRNRVDQSGKQYFFNGNYQRLGIMPNVALALGNFSIAYSVRLSQLSFYNSEVSDRDFWDDDIVRLNSRRSYELMEHCLQFRHGFKHVKFQLQIAAYYAKDANEGRNAVPGFVGSAMLGIVLNTNILGGSED